MTSLSDLKKWDIWLAKVVFEEDQTQFKFRPVLVLNEKMCFVLSLKITSHKPRVGVIGEYPIEKWSESGLLKPSTVRVSKRLNLLPEDFHKKLGTLQEPDRTNVDNLINLIYGNQ